jgi:hypothetical protein
VPTHIRVTVQRDREAVVAVTVHSAFGQATLSRRELEHLLAALRSDLVCDGQTISLNGEAIRIATAEAG